MAKDANITIKFYDDLKMRVVSRAKAEKRSTADEAAFLIEKGLDAIERDEKLLERVRAGLTDVNPEALRA